MNVDESFFQGEEREGFYIEPKMKRFWAAQMEVLEEIRRICDKHHIKWFADWGTLLGAVRHKGMVPWDDDMDICMLRDDWFRFMEVAPEELGPFFELRNVYNDTEQDNVIARIITGRHINFDEDYLERFHHCPFHAGIDIFAVDYIPRNAKLEKDWIDMVNLIISMSASLSPEPPYTKDDRELVDRIEQMTGWEINWNNRLEHELKKLADMVSARFDEDDSDDVGYMMRLLRGQHYHIPKEWYGDVIEMPFEYTTVPVPVGYDGILKLKYGDDYMTPKNVGGSHEYPIYKEQELALKEVMEREFHVEMTLEDIQTLIDAKVFGEV